VNFFVLSEIDERVEYIEGEQPMGRGIFPGSNIVQGVIGKRMAEDYNLSLGDLFPLSISENEEQPSVWLEVSGIVRPKNVDEPYWFGKENPLLSQSSGRWVSQYGIFLPADYFFDANEVIFDRPLLVLKWRVLLDHNVIQSNDIDGLHARISDLPEILLSFPIRLVSSTNLGDILIRYADQAKVIRPPLYMLTAEGVLLTLYYVVMVAALAVKQVEREFAILGSRGAAPRQIFYVQLSEALIISFVAMVSGPGLGVGMIGWISQYGPISDVAIPDWSLTLTASAWIAAFVGALASTLGLLLPVRPAVQRSIVSQTRSLTRETQRPIWQRLYLDVFLLVAGLIFFVRVQMYGGVARENVGLISQSGQVDWLLLLSPLALMIGSATILLRLFPLFLKVLEKLSSSSRGLTGVLAMWQAARNPNHVARLVLLLTLAMSLGVFSSGLNATLDQSEFERSQYAAGTDIRIISEDEKYSYGEFPEVLGFAETWRGRGSLMRRPYPHFNILAIEPKTLASISHFRDDYSQIPMGQLLSYLVVDDYVDPNAIYLPRKPISIGIWVWDDLDLTEGYSRLHGLSDLDRVRIGVKIRTAQGAYHVLNLTPEGAENQVSPDSGNYPEGGWQLFSAPIHEFEIEDYPLSLVDIVFQNNARRGTGQYVSYAPFVNLSISIDDLVVVDGLTGEQIIVTSFEDPAEIWQTGVGTMALSRHMYQAHSGISRLDITLYYDQILDYMSVRLPSETQFVFLPALVSPTFLDASGLRIGDRVTVIINPNRIMLEVKGIIDHFPTLYEDEDAGFVLLPRDPLLSELNKMPNVSVRINETWLRTDGKGIESLSDMVQSNPDLSLAQAEEIRLSMKADPLALGLRSTTSFGFIITTLLSLVGFATYFYISARQRETNYGVLRSIGLSPNQLYFSLIWEQVLLIFAGLALGTGLGMLINLITLSDLPITLGGQASVPPFQPRSNWVDVWRIYIALAISFIATMGVATIMLWRTKIHRALRIGEE
jgi:ABC-type lipoprotein release transport system permease subunit